jgi:hypothetical protein
LNPRAGISPTKKYFNPAELTTGSRRRLSRIWLRPDILEHAGTALASFEFVMPKCYANVIEESRMSQKSLIILAF